MRILQQEEQRPEPQAAQRHLHSIAGAGHWPAAAAGVTARLLEAAEAQAALPGLRRHQGQPALLLQGGRRLNVITCIG